MKYLILAASLLLPSLTLADDYAEQNQAFYLSQQAYNQRRTADALEEQNRLLRRNTQMQTDGCYWARDVNAKGEDLWQIADDHRLHQLFFRVCPNDKAETR